MFFGSAAPAAGKTRAEGDGEPDERTEAVASAGLASAIGDSAMLGAIDALEQEMSNLVLIDAQGNRQVHNQDLAEILEYPRHLIELLCCQRAVDAYVDDHYVPEMAGRVVLAE